MPGANVIAFNSTIAVTGTTQALDPNGVEPLAYGQTLTITALSTNAATLYISNKPGTGAGVGYPLEAGKSTEVIVPNTGLFITGSASDKYGCLGS